VIIGPIRMVGTLVWTPVSVVCRILHSGAMAAAQWLTASLPGRTAVPSREALVSVPFKILSALLSPIRSLGLLLQAPVHANATSVNVWAANFVDWMATLQGRAAAVGRAQTRSVGQFVKQAASAAWTVSSSLFRRLAHALRLYGFSLGANASACLARTASHIMARTVSASRGCLAWLVASVVVLQNAVHSATCWLGRVTSRFNVALSRWAWAVERCLCSLCSNAAAVATKKRRTQTS
jgi:hypothetical protein